MDKEKSCCFTGHRDIDKEKYIPVMAALRSIIEEKINRGYKIFCVGGALGFDTMAALAALKMKQEYRKIKLHMYLPCKNQAEKWSAYNRGIYEDIIKKSDRVFYISENYTPYCMQERNRALVDNSSLCIAYCTQPKGGTAYTIGYAMDNDVEVINLAHMI